MDPSEYGVPGPQPPVEQKKNGGGKAAAIETGMGRSPVESEDAEWQSVLPLLRRQADQFRRVVGLQQAKTQEPVPRSVGD